MRLSRPVVASAVVLTAMAVTGFASRKTEVPETTPVVVEATEGAPAAPATPPVTDGGQAARGPLPGNPADK